MNPTPMAHLSQLLARWRRSPDPGRRNRRTHITALDLDGGGVRIVQASLRGSEIRVHRHLALPLALPPECSADDPEAVGNAIARLFAEHRIEGSPVVMGVPRSHAILRVLKLPPAATSAEVAAMVHFQIGRDLPFRLEDTVLDFKLLPSPPEPPEPPPTHAPSTTVLAAVVRRDKVEFFPAVARAAGLQLASLGLRPLAAAAAAVWCQPEARLGCLALVTVHPAEIAFDVLVEGHLVFSRAGALPAPALDSPPTGNAEAPTLEIVRSIHDYEGVPGHAPLTAFLVAGTTGREGTLADALALRYGLPARVLDPAARLRDVEGQPTQAGGALPALGLALLALDPGGQPIDFLAPKNPPVPVDNRRLRRLAAVAGILAVFLSLAGIRSRWIRQREAVRADLRQQVTLASKNLPGYRSLRAQARAVADWSAAGRQWLDHLTLLSALLPPSRELHVTSLATTARNSLALSVRVRSGEIIDRLSSDLRQAGFLVKPPGITPVQDRGGYRFQASLEIDAPAVVTNQLDTLEVRPRPAPRPNPPESAAPAPTTPLRNLSPSPPVPAGPSATQEDRPARRLRRRPEGGPRE